MTPQAGTPEETRAAKLEREAEIAGAVDVLHGIALENGRLVIAAGRYIYRLAPDTLRIVDQFETVPVRGGLAHDGRYLWQRSERSHQQVELRAGMVKRSVPLRLEDVTGIECIEGDLLVLHRGGSRLARVRIEEHALEDEAVVLREAETGAEPLRGLAWTGGDLWSATTGALVRLDPRSGNVLQRLALPAGVSVCDLAGDGERHLYCVDGTSRRVRVFSTRVAEGERPPPPVSQAPVSSRVTDVTRSERPAPRADAEAPEVLVGGTFRRVLVPIDFSPSSRRALGVALCLHDRFGSEVHLVHAAEQGANAEFLAGAGARVGYGDLAEDARGELVRFVEHVFPGRSGELFVHASVGADRVRTIEQAARSQRATLVILAGKPSHATFFRNPVERIARDLDAAVMVLEPEGNERTGE